MIRNVLGCCLVHLCIGSIYASSVLYEPILKSTGWESYVPVAGFSLTILVLGFTASLFRKFCQGESLFQTLVPMTILYILAQSVQLMSVTSESQITVIDSSSVYLISSALLGVPLGVLYQTTVSEVTKYTNHIGLCSGLVVSSFGIGSLIASQVYGYLFSMTDFMGNLVLYLVPAWAVLIIGTVLLSKSETLINREDDISVIRNNMWRLLYAIFFFNITVGIGLLSNLVKFSTNLGNLSLGDAVVLVGIAGLSNGCGRLILATLSDYYGRLRVLWVGLFIQCVCTILLPYIWSLGVVIIIAVYGGGFALMPGICKELFKDDGTKAYGLLLSAWGLAGIVGTLASNVFGLSAITIFASIALILIVKLYNVERRRIYYES